MNTPDDSGEIQRAIVTKANPRLTAHTVQSMPWGADLGWTTLTANRMSVKAILREMKMARITGRLDAVDEGDVRGEEGVKSPAIWVVDPRSLAEGMSNLATSGSAAKGAPAIECQTGTWLVSPRRGPKKKKFGSLNN